MKKILAKSFHISLTGAFVFVSVFAVAQTIHFQSGTSIRNKQLSHYYKMVNWNDSLYQEAAYWTTSPAGSVIEFMDWRMVFPPGYQQGGTVKYPMIIMLHGAGESGRSWTNNYTYLPTDLEYDNNDNHLKWGGLEHLNATKKAVTDPRSFPGIVIFPQSSYNASWFTGWDNGVLNSNGRMAVTIIEHMIQAYNVDPYRIYLHGLSNGGKGAWELAAKRPDLITAVLPMSGLGSDINIMTDVLVTTPLWLFQGGLDTNPQPASATNWINTLKNKGGNPKYTLYPDLDHGVWNTAYQENNFFSWMLAQDKRNIYVFGATTILDQNPQIKLGFSAGFLAYQWTKDGVDIPDATTRYYTATTPGAYAVRFTRKLDNVVDTSFPQQISQSPPVNGLAYKYYEFTGTVNSLVTFNYGQAPVSSGYINNYTNSMKQRNTNYVISFDGKIQIDAAGTYRFYTRSDDGTMLYIDGNTVVNNDGAHGAVTVSATYSFPAPGKYPIRVTYLQTNAGQLLYVRYNQGTTDNFSTAKAIPDNKLFLPDPGAPLTARADEEEKDKDKDKDGPHANILDAPGNAMHSSDGKVAVYPNPFKEELHIVFAKPSGNVPVAFYDLVTGKPVSHMNVDSADLEAVLNLSNLANGSYIVKVGNAHFRMWKEN